MAAESPANLYKYLPADRASVALESLLIRFSQASVLNDALELQPPLKGIATKPDLEHLLEERIRSQFPGVIERIEKSLPTNTATKIKKDAITKSIDKAEGEFSTTKKKIYEKLDHNFGILSLSEKPTDALMWSHYADGGRGILIEFDPRHSWFWAKKEEGDDFRHLRRVAYSSSRVKKYLLETTGPEVLYTKGKQWEYEKEWRIIRNFNDAASNLGPDINGKDILLFAIPPSCILGIVFGFRTQTASAERLLGIVAANPSLSHVRFSKAVLRSDGSIEIVSSAFT